MSHFSNHLGLACDHVKNFEVGELVLHVEYPLSPIGIYRLSLPMAELSMPMRLRILTCFAL
jgi:hypothetical protein